MQGALSALRDLDTLWCQLWDGCPRDLCSDGVQDAKVSSPDISISLTKTPK